MTLRTNTLCFLAVSALLLSGCYDVVVHHYPDRAAAEADQLFQKGWLPEIIPQSSRNIRTENDLDINMSEGEFTFDPTESATFVARLAKAEPGSLDDEEKPFLTKGYSPYRAGEHTFFVNASRGHCRYLMRLAPR